MATATKKPESKKKASPRGTTRKPVKAKRLTVAAEIKNFELVKAGSALTLTVRDEGELLGTLKLGHGSVMWRAADKKRSKRKTWNQLADWLNS